MNALVTKCLLLMACCSLSATALAGTCYRVTGEVWSHHYTQMIQQLEPLSSCYGKPCGKTYYPVFQNGQFTQYQVLDSEKVTNVYYEQIDTVNGQPIIIKSIQLSMCRNLITPCIINGPASWCFLETFSTTFDADAQRWHWEMLGTSWSATTSSPSVEINSLQFTPGTYTLRVRSSYTCQGRTYQSNWKTRRVRVQSKTGTECNFGGMLKTGGGGDRTNLNDGQGNHIPDTSIGAGGGSTSPSDSTGGSGNGGGSDRTNLATKMADSDGTDRMNLVTPTTNNDGSDRVTLLDENGNVIQNKRGLVPSSNVDALSAHHYSTLLEGSETAWFTNPHAYVLPVVLVMTDEAGETFAQTFELAPGTTQSYRAGDAVVFYEVLAMQDFLVSVGDNQTPVAVDAPLIANESFEIRIKQGHETLVGIDADGNAHYPLWQVESK